MSADFDPYRVLGLDHAAEPDVVATAYRALARSHHPDVSREPDAEARMAEINAAWAILRDRARRAAYDREHGIADARGDLRPDNPLRAIHRHATDPAQTQAGTASAGPDAARSAMGRPGQVAWRRGPGGEGAAGPPPGRPVGSVLPFGRHIGWSLGEVARVDAGYLQWLAARPEGAPYRAEIDALLAPLLRTADGRGPLNPSDGPAAHAGWARRPGR